MEARSQRASRITSAEYDADGQIIVTEGGGRHSLRSKLSVDGVTESTLHPEDARSWSSAGHSARTNGDVFSYTSSATSQVDRPASPPSNASTSYRRRSDSVPQATLSVASPGGTVSSASSSLLRRLGRRRRKRDDSSDDSYSDNTARHSDFSRKQAKRAGGRRGKKRRKNKKHQGWSIDKHSGDQTVTTRRYSGYDVSGPDNEYWREMVAEQRRRSSLDRPTTRRDRRASARRRSGTGSSDGRRLSVQPPRANGTSAVISSSGTDSIHSSGSRLLRQSSSTSKADRDCCRCCGSVVLPAAMFAVVGCLLLLAGIIRIFVCFWHEFGSGVWTGVMLLIFGCLHAVLARDYDRHLKTLFYIAAGVVTSAAVLVATSFSLIVLVPALCQVSVAIDDSLDTRVLHAVNFSKFPTNATVTGVVTSVTWPSVVLDLFCLVLFAVALYCQTATVIAVDRHWESNYKVTGDCRYCGPPRLCSPLDQMSLGQATIFVGLVEIVMLEYVPDHDSSSPHAWSMLWSGVLLIAAGFSGMCYGKRPDLIAAGAVSVTLMSCSLIGCAAAIVLTTWSIVKDADRLRVTVAAVQDSQSSPPYSLTNLAALVVVQGIADCIAAVGVLFVASNLFRQLRTLCRRSGAVSAVADTHQMSISSPTYQRPQVVANTHL